MDDWIDSITFRTSETWRRTKVANVYTEALFCVTFNPLPGLDLDSLLPNEALASIRVAHAWVDGTDQPSLVKDVLSIKTDPIKIIASDMPVIRCVA